MEQQDPIKDALRDFVATSNSGKYSSEDELLSKFPELKGFDKQVLRDFVATSNSGKYKTEEEIFSKFPEFQDIKKKIPTEPTTSVSKSGGVPTSPLIFTSASESPEGKPKTFGEIGGAPPKPKALKETLISPKPQEQPTFGELAEQGKIKREENKDKYAVFQGYEGLQSELSAIDKALNSSEIKNASRYVDKAEKDYLLNRKAELENKRLTTKQNATLNYKQTQAELDKFIQGDIKTNGLDYFTRVNNSGFKVADPEKIDEWAKNLSMMSGMSDEGYFKDLAYNKMKSNIQYEIAKPEIEKTFNSLYEKKYGKKTQQDIQAEFEKTFKAQQDIEQQLTLQVSSVVNQIKQSQQADINQIKNTYQPQLDALNVGYEQQTQEIKTQANALNQLYTTKQISYEDYVRGINELNAGIQQSNVQYKEQFNAAATEYLNAQRELNGKYAARYKRQVAELKAMADNRLKQELAKYQKEYKISPELQKRYNDTWKEATNVFAESEEGLKRGLDELKPSSYVFAQSVISGLGGAVSSLSTSLGYDGGKVMGDYLSSMFTLSNPEIKEAKDLLDLTKLSRSTGEMIGGMLPIMAAQAITATATGGLSIPTQLALQGGVAFTVETAQLGGAMYDETFERTGNVAEAEKAAAKVIQGNLYLLPLYAVDGLPFIDNATLGLKNIFLKGAAKGGVEVATELPQEFFQGAFEDLARSNKDISQIGENITLDRLENTLLNIVPSSFAMGATPTYLGDMKNLWTKIEAKSLAAKHDLSKLSETAVQQYMYDMYLRYGESFSKAYLSGLYQSNKIDEVQAKRLTDILDSAKTVIENSERFKLTKGQSKVYAALLFDYENAKTEAESATDEIVKDSLNKKANQLKAIASDYLSNKNAEFAVIVLPNNEQYVVTLQEATDMLDDASFSNKVRANEVKIVPQSTQKTEQFNTLENRLKTIANEPITRTDEGRVTTTEEPIRAAATTGEEGVQETNVPIGEEVVQTVEGEKAKPTEPAQSDKSYIEAQEVTANVSKENPEASVLIQPKGDDLVLTAVYVGKEKRGKGIGSKVLETVKSEADRLGKKVVLDATNELDSETNLERLGNFYEKNGFKKIGENKFEYTPQEVVSETPALRDVESTAKALEGVKGKSGKDVYLEAQKAGSENNDFDENMSEYQNQIEQNEYLLLNIPIEKLVENDPDLKEYIDAGIDESSPKRSIKQPIIIGNAERGSFNTIKDGVIDGFHRVEQSIINGEKFVKAYVPKNSKLISEAYHKAKADRSNPELVKAVEELITKQYEQEIKQKDAQPLSEGVRGLRTETEEREASAQLRTEKEEVKPELTPAEKTNLESVGEQVGKNFREVQNVYAKYGEGKPLSEITAEDYRKAQEKRDASKAPDIEQVAQKSGITPKNLKDLYNINRDLFGLDRIKSFASAIAMDRMVGAMAKRAGITKEQMYGRLDFKKDTQENVLKADNALFQGTVNGQEVSLKNIDIDVVNGFYSPIEKRLAETKIEKQSANKWLTVIGKGDEATWTGVRAWLESKNPQETVSKSEIQQWMKDNRISVVEVVKGEKEKPKQYQRFDEIIDTLKSRGYDVEVEDYGGMDMGVRGVDDGQVYLDTGNYYSKREDLIREGYSVKDTYEEDVKLLEEAKKIASNLAYRQQKEDTLSETKFSQYQLEGEKENYKEILVTLPNKNKYDSIEKRENDKAKELFGKSFDELDIYEKGKVSNIIATQSREIVGFKSTHFDEPNILVHLRMNTRTDADGNKVLFLEEVQSDWGQQGKREGFEIDKSQKIKELEEKLKQAWEKQSKETDFLKRGEIYETEVKPLGFALEEAKNQNRIQKTPTAPFVTDTNAWTKLGLKVALKEAVKQGADKIAWTTGEQQNDRYDLSKSVDKVYYNPKTKEFGYFGTDNLQPDVFPKTEPSKIVDYVGKDVAERLLNSEVNEDGLQELKGNDLKVGGKGMKGFYGSPTEGSLGIVGNVAKSLSKQEPKTIEITTQFKQPTQEIYESPNGNWFVDWTEENGRTYQKTFKTEKEAKVWAKENLTTTTSTQHSIDITPELRAEVERGLALFQREQGGKAKGAMVAADGSYVIYALTDPNVSTPLHELAHVFEHYLTDAEIATVIKNAGTKGWTTETSEYFARGFEKYLAEGKSPIEALNKVFAKFKEWLTEIYNGIKGSGIDVKLNNEMRSIYDKMLGVEKLIDEQVVDEVAEKVIQARDAKRGYDKKGGRKKAFETQATLNEKAQKAMDGVDTKSPEYETVKAIEENIDDIMNDLMNNGLIEDTDCVL